MKQFLSLIILIIAIFITGCGSDKKSEQVSPDIKKVETKNEMPVSETEDMKVANKVREYVKKYLDTKIDDITVNPDLGTEKNDDYVVLVRLTWNIRNSAEQSKKCWKCIVKIWQEECIKICLKYKNLLFFGQFLI